MGSLFRRTNSRNWWIKYWANGRQHRESTRTEKESEARRVLKEREGRVAAGQPVLNRADRVRYDEVAQDLRTHYRTTGSRNVEEAGYRLDHLDAFFSGYRVAQITPRHVEKYVEKRQAGGTSNGTINREVAVLIRMLRLANESGKLLRVPVIHKLKEGPPRRGFFEREQYEAVRRYLSPICRSPWHSSTRSAGDVRARCSPCNGASSMSRPAPCASNRVPRRTTRGGCVSPGGPQEPAGGATRTRAGTGTEDREDRSASVSAPSRTTPRPADSGLQTGPG